MAAHSGRGADPPGLYRFGDIVVDAAAHGVLRDNTPQPLEPKAFAVLLALLERPGELVGRDELLDRVWGHRHVTPGVLTRAIVQLRAALGDDSQNPRYIQTRHAVGYRFVGELLLDPVGAAGTGPGVAASAAGTAVAAERDGGLPRPLPDPAAGPRRDLGQGPGRAWSPRTLRIASLLAVLLTAGLLWSRYQGAPPAPAEASIAILPFASLSSDREDDYFAEGLAVEMHDALAGVEGLKVAARISPGATSGRETDVKALGAMLGVATVLDASVRRDGERVRINARLSDCRTGYTLWSRRYDRELSDVFATQTEIAEQVVRSLLDVLPGEREAIARRLTPTTDVAAFDAYLRGLRWLLRPGSGDSGERAIAHFNQALRHDERFARAQAGICRVQIWRFDLHRDAAIFDLARQACLRAEQLDPGLPDVSLALGDLYRINGDLDTALAHYRKIEHEPALRTAVLVGIARVHAARGDTDGAMERLRRALDAGPGNAGLHAEIGIQHYLAGRTRDAIASYRDAVRLAPEDARYWGVYGGLLMVDGDTDAAAVALRKSVGIEPSDSALSNLGTLEYQAGRYEEAGRLYRQAIELNPGDFMLWGYLGDALLADAATAARAREPFAEAAARAGRYLDIRPDDAQALAALGWYRANLGEHARAKALAERAGAHAGEGADSVEVALYNAQTLAGLGDVDGARRQLQAARQAGVAETRISTNAFLRRTGVIGEAADH